MEPDELLKAVNAAGTPVGSIITLLLLLAMVSGLFSKAAGDYAGILGSLKRALDRHKQEAIEADELSNSKRLERLEETVGRLDGEVDELREKDRIHHEYQLYVAGYWRKLQFWAVEKGVQLPPPPMLTYPEWKMTYYPSAV